MNILIFLVIFQIDLFVGETNIAYASTDSSASSQNSFNNQGTGTLLSTKSVVRFANPSQIGKKNPNTALLLSFLPGGGQFYTHNYLKGTAFALLQGAAAGATIYFWVKENKAKKENNTPDADYYYGQMYNCLWVDGFVWGFSMMDAYVSAHFYKFRDQSVSSGLEIGFRF
jgi:hypothetical protein